MAAYVPELYWQPVAEGGTTGAYQTLTFPTGVSVRAFEERPVRDRDGTIPPFGLPKLVNHGVSRIVTIEVAGLTYGKHGAFIRKLASVDSALTLGAVCHFTLDRPRRGAWALRDPTDASYVVPTLGDTAIYRHYDTLGAVVDLFGTGDPGGGSLTATDASGGGDDVFVIETEPLETHTHFTAASLITDVDHSVTLTEAWPHVTSADYAYARWWGFFPGLTLVNEALDQPRLAREDPMTWTWRVSFAMSPDRVFDLFP